MPEKPPAEKHDHHKLTFPENFLWGAATSAYQVEGGNSNSDWWAWEEKNQPENKRSGEACDQYHLYEEDFKLAKDLGHNSHRLSVEWSRIEPLEGVFDQTAIEHYVEVLKSLKNKNLTVMLTLWHFTLPQWLAEKGGWENSKSVFYFERFVEKVVPYFQDYVELWVTINEPSVYAYQGYIATVWPPQKKSKWKAFKVLWNMSKAHKKTYKLIHKIVKDAKVGIAHNVASFHHLHHHSIKETFFVWLLDILDNHLIYFLTGKKNHDFLGLNYYFHKNISFNGEKNLPALLDVKSTNREVSDLGWEIYPEGIFDAIMDFSDMHLPVYITENGLASTNDDRRVRFLISYLKEIYHAISLGVEVKGYFHWSLLDNFEWADGFDPRFGLIQVNFKTEERTPRPSSKIYQEIIKQNGIPHYMLRFQGHTVTVEEVLKRKNECLDCKV